MGEMLSSDDLRIEFTYEEATNTGSRQTGESAADEIQILQRWKNRDRDSCETTSLGDSRQRLELEEFFSLGSGA